MKQDSRVEIKLMYIKNINQMSKGFLNGKLILIYCINLKKVKVSEKKFEIKVGIFVYVYLYILLKELFAT